MLKALGKYRYMPARSAALLFAVLSVAMFTMAFQAAAAPAAAAPSMLSMIGKNALMGVIAALVGWGSQPKNDDGSHESWDWTQLPLTVLVGAGFGVYAALSHSTLGQAENSGWVPLVIAGLENVVKLLFRNAKWSVQKAFSTVKSGTDPKNPT